jgi:hypothetical protein
MKSTLARAVREKWSIIFFKFRRGDLVGKSNLGDANQ